MPYLNIKLYSTVSFLDDKYSAVKPTLIDDNNIDNDDDTDDNTDDDDFNISFTRKGTRRQISSDDEGNQKQDTEGDKEKDEDGDFHEESVLAKTTPKYSLSVRECKRRLNSFDDEDDDEKHDIEDENDETKSHSDNKIFKRIKPTYTSSLETDESVDPEEVIEIDSESSDNESESNNCKSKIENKDNEEIDDEEVLIDFIEQLKDFQDDDNGTIKLLQHYILWFAMKAGGEDMDEDHFQETIELKEKLDARLEVVMNICQSQAWGANFRSDVVTYPEFNDDVKHSDLKGGDMRHLGNCQVCNRESHPWSVIVSLEGEPYNKETFETRDEEEGESSLDLPAVSYYMGCFCHPRTKLFHKLYHFGHALYHKCKQLGCESFDQTTSFDLDLKVPLEHFEHDERKIDKVATNKSLFEQMLTKLKKLMKEAEQDYTVDGERGNNKWKREYEQC